MTKGIVLIQEAISKLGFSFEISLFTPMNIHIIIENMKISSRTKTTYKFDISEK